MTEKRVQGHPIDPPFPYPDNWVIERRTGLEWWLLQWSHTFDDKAVYRAIAVITSGGALITTNSPLSSIKSEFFLTFEDCNAFFAIVKWVREQMKTHRRLPNDLCECGGRQSGFYHISTEGDAFEVLYQPPITEELHQAEYPDTYSLNVNVRNDIQSLSETYENYQKSRSWVVKFAAWLGAIAP